MKESKKANGGGSSLSGLEIILVLVILAIVATGSVYFLSGGSDTRDRNPDSESADVSQDAERDNAGRGERSSRNSSDWEESARDENKGAQKVALPDKGQSKGDGSISDAVIIAKPVAPMDPASLSDAGQAALEDFKKALASADPLAAFGKERIQQLSATDLQACMDLARNMDPSPETVKLLREVVTRWAGMDPKAAADYTLSLSSVAMRTSLMTGVVDTWAVVDPKAAAAFVVGIESRQTRNAAIGSLINAWSVSDPTSALAWLRETPDLDRRTLANSTTTLFQSLFKQDPGQAMAQVWTLPGPEMKRAALRSMMTEMTSSQNEAALLSMYNQLPAGADRILLSQAVVENLARFQPQRAQEWITRNITDPGERNSAISHMVETWSVDDPAQAAQWFATQFATGNLRNEQLGSIMRHWVNDNPAQASDWLSRYPRSPQTDYAVQALAEGLADNTPGTAVRWAESITDPNLRTRTIQAVASEWMRRDPAGAAAYINSSSLPDNIKTRLLQGQGRGGRRRR